MNRALRAATMGVLLLSPSALAACSAGQVTQTATQDRDKVGPMAEANGILLRKVLLEYPDSGSYDKGDDAELQMAIVNNAPEADRLVEVSGEGFDSAEIVPARSTAQGTTATSDTGGSSEGVEIPSDTTVYVGADDGPTITLTGLAEEMTVGRHMEVVFTFENAGELPVVLTVATPEEALPRGEEFDFHEEEAAEGDHQDTEVAGGGSGEDTEGGHGEGGHG